MDSNVDSGVDSKQGTYDGEVSIRSQQEFSRSCTTPELRNNGQDELACDLL